MNKRQFSFTLFMAFNRTAAALIFCSSIIGCDIVKTWVGNQSSDANLLVSSTITGRIHNSLSSCTDTQIHLYKFSDDGKRFEPPITSDLVSSGEFQLNNLPVDFGITGYRSEKSLLLMAWGCGEIYARVVTSARNQDLSLMTTVAAAVLNTENSISVLEALKNSASLSYAQLIEGIDTESDVSSVINKFKSSHKERYERLVGQGQNPDSLYTTPPFYVIKQIPEILTEQDPATFSIEAQHWNPSYNERVEWRESARIISEQREFIYLPGKNSQNNMQRFNLIIGEAQSNTFSSSPKTTLTFDRTVADSFPAEVPPTVLASAARTVSSVVHLQMTTGPSQSNCETFSKLAITENTDQPPDSSLFNSQNISCTSDLKQNLTYNLLNTSDGLKILRVWTLDSGGNISRASATINMTLDSTAPVLGFSTPAADSAFNSGIQITGTCEVGFDVNVAGDGVSASQSASCLSPGSFTTNISFTSVDGAKSVLISQTNLSSNTVTATRSFVLDTAAPVLSMASPPASTSAQTGVTISGSCEAGLTVYLAGSGLISPSSTSCISGSFTQDISFTDGEGIKSITVSQTDAAGNIGSASRDFIRDNTGPTMAIVSPADNTSFRGSALISGTCETGGSNLTIGGDASSPSSTACSGTGTFSVSVVFTSGEGAKTISLTQNDSAGNLGMASVTLINDNTPPSLSIISPPSGTSAQAGVTITGTCEGVLPITIGGAGLASPTSASCNFGSFTQAVTFTAGDSVKVISISQIDAAGNMGSDSRSFAKDTTSPTITFATPAENTSAQNGVTVTGTCEDGLVINLAGAGLDTPSTVSCNSGAFSQALTFTAGEGTKTITVSQTDLAGNTGSISRNFVRDNTGPTLAITSPADSSSFRGSATISGTCETGSSALTISGNTSSPSSTTCSGAGSFSITVTFSAGEGAKTITFSQNDSAGNTGQISINLINDNISPALSFTSPISNTSAQAGVTIEGTCEGVISITIGGTGLSSPSSTTCNFGSFSQAVTFTSGDGNKTITVSQTDSAGNNGSASRDFIKDTLAPTVTITAPAANTSAISGVTIAGTCENGLTVNLSGTDLSSPTTTNCASGTFNQAITFTSGDGTKNIIVSQTDLAGNTTTVNRDYIKDSTAPAITITGPAPGTAAQSNITLTGNCEDSLPITYGGSGILSSFSGACTGGTFSQMVFFSGGDGSKTIAVSQTDAAGNSTTASQTFSRDNVTPNLTQTTLSFPHYSKNNTVTFGGTCESGLTVSAKISGTTEGTTSCTAGTWNFTTLSKTTDATYDYSFEQTDSAGNATTTAGRFIRDTVVPTLTFTSSSTQLTASNSVTFSGTCESGIATIVVAGGTDSTSTTCSSGTWSYTTATQTTDGTRTYTFKQTDQAGNATTISATWERNTSVPNLLITTATPIYNGNNTAHVDGACETGLNITIKLSGATEATIPCSAGTFSYDFASQTTDASRTYEFKQTNALSLSTIQNFTWVRDTTAPSITATSFSINSGAASTGRANVKLAIQASDSLSKITKFCFKVADITQPSTNDSCWVDVELGAGLTASQNLSLLNYSFILPIVPNTYSVYAWVKDQVGNTSTLTNSGLGTLAKDLETIDLLLATPPTVNYVLVGSTDYPANPPSEGDLTAGVGSPIFIKWKASDDLSLPATPISIYFSTDDSTWTLVANNLLNSSNGSCIVNNPSTPADNDATGCYKLTAAPTSGYLKFRVIVTDSDGLQTAGTSVGMNIASTIRFLAGNTDPGTNLSAQSAMFFYRRMSDLWTADAYTLAVDRNGVVYFKDANRGIMKVDPADGVAKVFLRATGTSSGDGGPLANATAHYIISMTLDHNKPTQRLWFFDYNAIRRIDLATGIVTTVIGGSSATDNSDNVDNPLNARVDYLSSDPEWWHNWTPFFSLPNGDFYFQAGNDGYFDFSTRPNQNLNRIRYLEASTGKIKSYRITNLTTARGLPTGNYNDCQIRNFAAAFDPTTSAILKRLAIFRVYPGWPTTCSFADHATFESLEADGSSSASHPDSLIPGSTAWYTDRVTMRNGLNGKIYAFVKSLPPNGIYRYDEGVGWTKILGHSSNLQGSCPDNTDALDCRTRVADVWVSETGTVYFLDNGLIRTITPANKVVTLMGQGQLSGMGGPALSARLSNFIRTFRMANDGRITFTNQSEMRLFDIDTNGGNLYVFAGNEAAGSPTLGVDSLTTYFNAEHPNGTGEDFGMDPVTGDIYTPTGEWRIAKLTRSSGAIGATGVWSNLIGYGSNNWLTSDNLSDIGFNNDCSIGLDTVNNTLWSCWILPKVLAFSNGKLLTHSSNLGKSIANNTHQPFNNMMKIYDINTKIQTHFLGHVGHNTTTGNYWDGIGPVGSSAATADFWSAEWSRVATPYNISGNRWLFSRYSDNNYKSIYDVTVGGTLEVFATLPSGPKGFTYRLKGTDEYIYYCSVTDSRLHRYHKQTSTDVALSWPVPGMACVGSALFYRSSTQGIVFSYQQNGMMGFAEYFDPMP